MKDSASRFWALPPDRLPSILEIRSWLDSALAGDLRGLVRACGQGFAANAPAKLQALLQRLPPVQPAAPSAAEVLPGTGGFALADDDAHDRYFGVARMQGVEEGAFLRSLLQAMRLFTLEQARVPAGTDPGRFEPVGGGLLALLGGVLGVRVPQVQYTAPAVLAPAAEADPMRRWMAGHQIFLVLTQGITLALQEFEAAARPGSNGAALTQREALLLATALMNASAMAFRFTADFGPAVYARTVRPSMSAAQVGEGFSGLLSVDHRQLVTTMGRVRPLLQRAASQLPEHEGLVRAFAHVYSDHRFVCARFVGTDEPSLRCPSATMSSGVKQLDRLARTRLKLLGAPARSGVG